VPIVWQKTTHLLDLCDKFNPTSHFLPHFLLRNRFRQVVVCPEQTIVKERLVKPRVLFLGKFVTQTVHKIDERQVIRLSNAVRHERNLQKQRNCGNNEDGCILVLRGDGFYGSVYGK